MGTRFMTCLSLLLGVGVAGCTTTAPQTGGVAIANPASVYCLEQGGRLESRQGEGGASACCHLADGRVVEAWDYYRARNGKAGLMSADSITEKYWKLVELNGQPVPRLDREPHMILKAEGGRVNGVGGCNRFTGTYTLDEQTSRIRFGPLASTERACPAGMDVEQAFSDALARADSYSLNGDRLSLNRARMAPLARFEAVWLQ